MFSGLKKRWSSIEFHDPKVFRAFCLYAPFVFGLISLLKGADANWDLANYHLYNPFAWLHHKLDIDLAPAGMQTYFNPLLDLPYYWMCLHLPAPFVGFVMGATQGLNFILLALIAKACLSTEAQYERNKISLLLAIFGCLTANFMMSLGNTMGDNITAIFVLTSVVLLIKQPTELKYGNFLLAGLAVGLGAGLKLTNAVYAVALCVSIAVLPFDGWKKFKFAFSFGCAVILGLAVTSGYWFYTMWHQFGNPLFPQFSTFFPNELTQDVAVVDTRWRPLNFFETLVWPFIISFNPLRSGELPQRQIVWATVYVALLACCFVYVTKNYFKRKLISFDPAAKFLICFVVVGFVVWMEIFSIQRYLTPIEICTPLVFYILITSITDGKRGRRYAVFFLIITTFLMVVPGMQTWGRAGWTTQMFRIDLPPLEQPDKASVILAGGSPPLSWTAALFPPTLSFVQIGGSFPAKFDTYKQRLDQIFINRSGPIYAMFQGERESSRIKRAEKFNAFFTRWSMNTNKKGCDFLQSAINKLNLQSKVRLEIAPDNTCKLIAKVVPEIGEQKEDFIASAQKNLASYGYELDVSSCQTYNAYIGQKAFPYQWCRVTKNKLADN